MAPKCARCGRFTTDYSVVRRLAWSLSDNPGMEEDIVCSRCHGQP